MKTNKQVERAKAKLENFSARGDKCPICHKDFRHGCDHSVRQAKDRLFQKYIYAIIKHKSEKSSHFK